jgi:preprotein translocase subunit SecA
MVTGEGKTLVATLPSYLNALAGKGVHVVTVNDYLARRDMEWMGPLHRGLGLTVGAIQSDMGSRDRQLAYDCDITYGTNNEFGFDYLRDNMRPAARGDDRFEKQFQQAQGPLNYAIIDEVDNILIDEARTPLIISGPAHDNVRKYAEADRIARQLKMGDHFEVNEKDRHVHLTDAGVREAERMAGVESFYTAGNMEWPHLIDNALKAHFLYKLDVNYVVKDGAIVIVDEFTGRLMEGRQWSDGLHQAVEVKEGVKIKEETQTLATITLQNFFKLYNKISGMTGTAMTEAGEFWKIYKLDVIAVPTNRGLQRLELPDLIYCTEEEKFGAIAHDIERTHKWDVLVSADGSERWGMIQSEDDSTVEFKPKDGKEKQTIKKADVKNIQHRGRPILVGTTSIEKSERLSRLLDTRGIQHEVLNAKQHRREAAIVAQAGRMGAVTIATNMAGRGTDIILGGNPETLAWAKLQEKYATRLDVPREEWDALVHEIEQQYQMRAEGERIKSLGGLHVIGTERHEARRIDLQLRGRCGRQGDPGSSRFYLSLRDDLMRIFAGPWVEKILKSIGMQEGEAIESRMVTRRIEAAQKKVEERNFEIRKNLLEYDEVMDEQRKRVYGYRQQILDGRNCKELVLEMINDEVAEHLATFLASDYGTQSFANWAGTQLNSNLEPREFAGESFESASHIARDAAVRQAETAILESIEENLPEDSEDEDEWNWGALARFANTRFGLNLRDRDLKKEGRMHVSTLLVNEAQKAIQKVNLSQGEALLDPEFGVKSAVGWIKFKFGLELNVDDLKDLELPAAINFVQRRAAEMYDRREAEYPVIAAFHRFSRATSEGTRIDRHAIAEWGGRRFEEPVDVAAVEAMPREQIYAHLCEMSRRFQSVGNKAIEEFEQMWDDVFGQARKDSLVQSSGVAEEKVSNLLEWTAKNYDSELTYEKARRMTVLELSRRLGASIEDHFRPEIRRMERALLLQLVDSAWKEHLLAMDHLRSAVGLVGYAQVDPKVEFKREGKRLFDDMWKSFGQRVTDLFFKMEQLNEGFVGSTWVETSAKHEEGPSATDIARQQQDAIDMSQRGGDEKVEPIRHRGDRVGRNDPCPCGSGKKYKNCHMRANEGA